MNTRARKLIGEFNMKLSLLALVFLVGCSTTHLRVSKVDKGDGEEKVIKAMGEPSLIKDSEMLPGAKTWYYLNNSDEVCVFTMVDHAAFERGMCKETIKSPNEYSLLSVSLKNSERYFKSLSEQKPAATRCVATEVNGVTKTECK